MPCAKKDTYELLNRIPGIRRWHVCLYFEELYEDYIIIIVFASDRLS